MVVFLVFVLFVLTICVMFVMVGSLIRYHTKLLKMNWFCRNAIECTAICVIPVGLFYAGLAMINHYYPPETIKVSCDIDLKTEVLTCEGREYIVNIH